MQQGHEPLRPGNVRDYEPDEDWGVTGDWFKPKPKSADSIMSSDNEKIMFEQLNYYLMQLNTTCFIRPVFDNVYDQPAPQLSDNFSSFVTNEIEEEDFDIWLPQNPKRNVGKTLEIGGQEYIVHSKSGTSLIWAMTGVYNGTTAYDLPDSQINWIKKNAKQVPPTIIEALEQSSFGTREDWEDYS